MPVWADQPGPGRFRLAGARNATGQALVTVWPHGTGRVTVEWPIVVAKGGRNDLDFGGRETGVCPATSTAGIRVAERLCRMGPDLVRFVDFVWRWERFDDPGRGPGRWVSVQPVGLPDVPAVTSSALPGQETEIGR